MKDSQQETVNEPEKPAQAAENTGFDIGSVTEAPPSLRAEASARHSLDRLLKLAEAGDAYALHAANTLALDIAKRIAALGRESEFEATTSAIPADLAKRRDELKAAAEKQIGTSVGFPKPKQGRGRPPEAAADSPAGLWRDICFFVEAMRDLLALGSTADALRDGLPLQLDDELIRSIAALPDFGTGGRDQWLSAGCDLLTGNLDELCPDWLRVRCANSENGLPSLAMGTLEDGLAHCWPATV